MTKPWEVESGECALSGNYVRDTETLDQYGHCGRCEACLESELEDAEQEDDTPSFFAVVCGIVL